MYLGGDIIAAIECDYDSSKELGLTCPFCSAAVFLRSGFVRGETKVRPCFSHYAIGGQDDWYCERRSISKQGLEEIRAIKTESRNQRLRLYNCHLWDMIADGIITEDKALFHAQARSLFKPKRWDDMTEMTRNYLSRFQISGDLPRQMQLWLANLEKGAGGTTGEYLSRYDRQFHLEVCQEVFNFLISKSAVFTLKKILKAVILALEDDDRSNKAIISAICLLILTTPWREQINKYSGKAVSQRAIGFASK